MKEVQEKLLPGDWGCPPEFPYSPKNGGPRGLNIGKARTQHPQRPGVPLSRKRD